MSQKNKVKINFPFFGIMFLILMTLKLTGHIAWSWWWVTAPLWMPFTVVVGILLIALTVILIADIKVDD